MPLLEPVLRSHFAVTTKQPWRWRDACVISIGMVLPNLSEENRETFVKSYWPFMIKLLRDEIPLVRYSALFAIRGYCNEAVEPYELIRSFIEDVIFVLIDHNVPRILELACEILYTIIPIIAIQEDHSDETNALSPHVELIIAAMWSLIDADDIGSEHVIIAAYEVMNKTVMNSALDKMNEWKEVLNQTLTRLDNTWTILNETTRDNIQLGATALIGEILKRFENAVITETETTKLVNILARMLQTSSPGVREDIYMTLSQLCNALSKSFKPYLKTFELLWFEDLKKPSIAADEASVHMHIAAMGLIVDICRALENEFKSSLYNIIHIICQQLKNGSVHRYAFLLYAFD
jgi:importin subunit beta-1